MISAAFSILRLPSVSSKETARPPAAVSGDVVHLGVSHGSVSTLSLKPPRVADAYSVSPGTVVTAVAAGADGSVGYTTRERTKPQLRTVAGAQVKLDGAAAGLHAADDLFVVIREDLVVQAFSADALEAQWQAELPGAGKSGVRGCATLAVEGATILVVLSDADGFHAHLVSADASGLRVLVSSQLATEKSGDAAFAYADGVLYRCDPGTNTLYLYSVPDLQLLTSFAIGGAAPTQILALPHKNLLVQQGERVSLVDCTYQSLLAEREVPKLEALVAYIPEAGSALAVTKHEVVGLAVEPSAGTLLESIGHAVATAEADDASTFGHADIFNEFKGPVSGFKKVARAQVAAAQAEARAVLADVRAGAAAGDAAPFLRLLSYVKAPETAWEACKPAEADAAFAFDDSDRALDRDLLVAIVELVFNVGGKRVGALPAFVPTSVPVYLLTHPLFPAGDPRLANLLPALEAHPLLYRQAVVTLPGISPRQLLAALLSADEDIFGDAVARLRDEFSYHQIVATVKGVFGSSHRAAELTKLVTRLSRHPGAWTLVAPFVDAIGLLSWDPALLARLQARLRKDIATLEGLAELDVVVAELLRSSNYDLKNDQVRPQRRGTERPARADAPHVPRYSVETLTFN